MEMKIVKGFPQYLQRLIFLSENLIISLPSTLKKKKVVQTFIFPHQTVNIPFQPHFPPAFDSKS